MQDEKQQHQPAGDTSKERTLTAEERLRRAAEEARRAVDAAQPHVSRAVERAKPQVERAAKQAKDYARDHDTELRRAAVYLARFAVPRPLKLAFDMLVPVQQQRPVQQPADDVAPEVVAALKCPSCSWLNPQEARYCNQCGIPILQNEP